MQLECLCSLLHGDHFCSALLHKPPPAGCALGEAACKWPFQRVSKGFSKKLCLIRVCLSAKRTTTCLFSWMGGKPLKVMESLNQWWARQPASFSREVQAQCPTRTAAAIPGLQQSSEPGSSDPQHFSRDFGNLCNFQSGARQRRDKHQQKLGTLWLLPWFLINLLQSWL